MKNAHSYRRDKEAESVQNEEITKIFESFSKYRISEMFIMSDHIYQITNK